MFALVEDTDVKSSKTARKKKTKTPKHQDGVSKRNVFAEDSSPDGKKPKVLKKKKSKAVLVNKTGSSDSAEKTAALSSKLSKKKKGKAKRDSSVDTLGSEDAVHGDTRSDDCSEKCVMESDFTRSVDSGMISGFATENSQ